MHRPKEERKKNKKRGARLCGEGVVFDCLSREPCYITAHTIYIHESIQYSIVYMIINCIILLLWFVIWHGI